MSVPFLSQLEPFEENQSPSPTREHQVNPWESSLNSSPTRPSKSELSSPDRALNSLHRQLSGDPDNPPPAWKRRSSVSSNRTGSTRTTNKSIDLTTLPPRTHQSLAMTMTAARPPIPHGVYLHESPNASSTSLDNPILALPQPSFRRRKGGSNRSSIASNVDLSSLTSEELWSMEHDVDVSNPHTRSAERPLDTIKRMSGRIDNSPFRGSLPNEVIWPTAAPGEEHYQPPNKSRSVTSMASLRAVSRRGSRLGPSRKPSMDFSQINTAVKPADKSNPASPSDFAPREPVFIASNNSSSTSLASKPLSARPPSVYYSRDFLSSLAPREGGYAIAATMGNGLGAHGAMAVDSERRRGTAHPEERTRPSSRAPLSRSSGMGRWSLDGGENYTRPYTNNSTNTTSTTLSASLSARGTSISGNSPPPPEDDASGRVSLPQGASPAINPAARGAALDNSVPVVQTAAPVNPSPLSRQTTVAELHNPGESVSSLQPPVELVDDLKPTPDPQATPKAPTTATVVNVTPPAASVPNATAAPAAVVSTPTKNASPLQNKKSKKDLAKEAKAAAKQAKVDQKAAMAKLSLEKAKAAREIALKREAEKQAEKKRKEELKRKEKEEKARLKAEKKTSKTTTVVSRLPQPSAAVPSVSKVASTTPAPAPAVHAATPTPTPQAQAIPASVPSAPQTNGGAVPLPRSGSANPIVQSETSTTPEPSQTSRFGLLKTPARRLGMFGTIKKRFSVLGDLGGEGATPRATRTGSTSTAAVPTVPGAPATKASVLADVPPRLSSRAAELSVSDLPPRSTSRGGEAKADQPGSTTPQSFHSATMSDPEQTGQVEHSSTAVPIAQSISRDRVSSSPASLHSVRGPRPMPRSSFEASRDRRASGGSVLSETDKNTTGSGLDFGTPSTTAESSMFSQHLAVNGERAMTDMSTPFTSEAGDSAAESEKDSSETVAPGQGAQGVPGVQVPAAVPVTTVVPVVLASPVPAH